MRHAVVDKDTGKILSFFDVEDDAHAEFVLVGAHHKVPLPDGHAAHSCEIGDDFPGAEEEGVSLLDKVKALVS